MPEFIYYDAEHSYHLDGKTLSGVTTILSSAGVVDSTWFTEESRERGSAVHTAIHYAAEGDLDFSTVDETIAGYVEAHEKFMAESKIEPLLIEAPGYHPKYLYGGKPDMVGFMNGKLYIIDFKTSDHQPWHAIQLIAYANIIEYLEGYEAIADRLCRGYVPRCGTVSLKDNGNYNFKRHPYQNDFQVFLACLTVHRWKQGK